MYKFIFILLTAVSILMIFSCAEDSSLVSVQDEIQSDSNTLRKKCTSVEHTEKLLNNPKFRKSYEQRMSAFQNLQGKALTKALCSNPTVIPIAIHYQGVNNPNTTCLINLAKKQVEILNEDFHGTNSDISKWTGNASSSFPGVNFGETCIKFCIADQSHPSGFGLSEGQPAITINKTQGDQVNQWSGYLNIYVQFGTGALGYAPYGGSGNGDGVVIEATAFGASLSCGSVTPESPYDLGRTTTHEVGHYFLLDHIWGNGCGVDDEVGDTPSQSQDYSGCPNIGQSSCGSTDLHMNYMDYTDDACMYMLTNGQSQRMENYMNANLGNLKNNASTVCSEASQGGGGGGGDNPDDCITPTDLSANTTTSSISFDWSDISGAISYRIGLRAQGTSSWNNQNPTVSQYTFSNLSSGTGYEYRIRTRCSDGFTTWSSISSIQTEEEVDNEGECDTPTSINAGNITASSADIIWEASPDAIRYQLRYRLPGDSWTRVNTNSPSTTLSGLFSDEIYEYKVRTRCDFGWTAYTAKKTFTTDADGGGGGTGNSNSFTVEITLDDYGSETTWYIVNTSYDIIAEGGPYGDFRVGVVKRKDVELEDDCYTFVIEDYYGDGICCDYGHGSAKIVDSNNNTVAASDGRFGYYDEIEFCIQGGASKLGKSRKDVKSKKLAKKKK